MSKVLNKRPQSSTRHVNAAELYLGADFAIHFNRLQFVFTDFIETRVSEYIYFLFSVMLLITNIHTHLQEVCIVVSLFHRAQQ